MNHQSTRNTKLLPLIAAGLALCIIIGSIYIGWRYATHVEQTYIHTLAPLHLPITMNGVALQKTAFGTPDLLPIYGASESLSLPGPFQADQFFKTYPTGFAPFEVATGGARFITEAEMLGSLGKSLEGKKVVITFTPSQFSASDMPNKTYDHFFSDLQANELIFSLYLSFPTKQVLAKHMLMYPETLQSDTLLAFAIHQLSDNTLLSQVLYYLTFPLGRLQTSIIELQDHYEVISYVRSHKKLNPVISHVPATINWQADLVKAKNQSIKLSRNNPFGFSADAWNKVNKTYLYSNHSTRADTSYLNDLKISNESRDLALLLQILKELGARPLLVGRPINDKYYNSLGISDKALNGFYTDVDTIAAQYNVPIVDYKEFQNDIHFGVDPAPHTSPEGWVYVDKMYNDFYHETNN